MRYLIELRIEVVRFKEDWKKFSGGKLTKFPDCRGGKKRLRSPPYDMRIDLQCQNLSRCLALKCNFPMELGIIWY